MLLLTFAYGCASYYNLSKYSYYNIIDPDTVKAQRFDTGKLWTFEYPPIDYFKTAYGFKPTEQWLDKVRKSALRFSTYCSASFVSEDGLIMTNDHCGRSNVTEVTRDGEDLQSTSFFAEKLEDERSVSGLFVDQLVLVKDVTKEILDENLFAVKNEEDLLNKKIDDITNKYKNDTGLEVEIVSLYNGALYSLYGYKRYKDIRLVFSPETQLGFFGGAYDNFTYPRYNLDVTFFRAYNDSGKPLKTENYFKWSLKGIIDSEVVFVVGNPARTNRLCTISQLEYLRDVQYPNILKLLNSVIEVSQKEEKEHPEKATQINDRLYSLTNSQKVYNGEIKGLYDPYLMARKKDFEKSFRKSIESHPILKTKYGDLWDNIAELELEMKKYARTIYGYSLYPMIKSDYFDIAKDVILLATQVQVPEDKRLPQYKSESLNSTKATIFPKDFDKYKNDALLKVHLDYIIDNLGQDNGLVQKLIGNRKRIDAANYLLSKSKLTSKESLIEFLKLSPEQILNSDDPFIYFLLNTQDKLKELKQKVNSLKEQEEVFNKKLGKAIYEVYGTSIPPDATFTLRIAAGIVQDYNYNGTKAPIKTTFYGMYDRYYSFNGKFPWSLPERWKNPPAEFDLSTPFNFISTNDAVGGSSGSPVINKNAEIVGIAFDGNIEGLPGDFIYATEINRSVNVASEGIMECVKDMYKATRLSEELEEGKIPEKYLKKSEEEKNSIND
jgi:hypothetical protein